MHLAHHHGDHRARTLTRAGESIFYTGRMHDAVSKTFALGFIALFLAGCGLKGPLHLPDEQPQTVDPAPGAAQSEPTKRRTAPPAPQSQKEDAAQPTPPPGG